MFADFARAHGLLIDYPVCDGRVHRCATLTHPHKKNGAYRYEGNWGWVQDWASHAEPVTWRAGECGERIAVMPRQDSEKRQAEHAARRAQAAIQAEAIVRRCRTATHPYLAQKGFAQQVSLIDTDGRLVVPLRDIRDYRRINSVQWIDDAGNKRFLPGGAAKGAVMMIGSGMESWLCEGYATALSVRAALQYLHRPACVIVCFSAGNLTHVAPLVRDRRFVVADHDASGTGERAAAATGLPWGKPPEADMDANDFHRQYGVQALAELMREVIASE